MMLQQNGWNLEKAVQKHFGQNDGESSSPAKKPKMALEKTSESGPPNSTTRAPETLTVVSWNIDGLSHKNLKARTRAVCAIIQDNGINVVFLQEVVKDSLALIKELLPEYQCLCEENDQYFNAVLLRRFTIYVDGFEYQPFSSSMMGRGLFIVDCHVGKAKFKFINTHLESTKVKRGPCIQ